MAAFVNCELIEQEIKNEFNQILLRLKFNEYRDAIENSLKINTDKQSDAIKSETDTEEKRKYKIFWKKDLGGRRNMRKISHFVILILVTA